MKFEFEASKGCRVHRYFLGVQVVGGDAWWNIDLCAWEDDPRFGDYAYSTSASCRTFKAFKRMIRKNPIISGKAVLVNRYIGLDIYSKQDEQGN